MQVDELYITQFTDTGLTTLFPRFTFVVRVKWIDDEGVAQDSYWQRVLYK